MLPYLYLVISVIVIPWITELLMGKNEKKNIIALKISIIIIFFIFALRAPSVGRDIMGYKSVYNSMRNASWANFDIYWMEWGYELLMLLFSHILHADFHLFLACIYAFVCNTYYRFIKRYSSDYTTAVLMYICVTFFTFDMSGIRNMLAFAICLRAYEHIEKSDKKSTLKFFILVFIAAQMHTSAYIFILAYIVMKLPVNTKTLFLYFMGGAVVFAIRKPIIRFIKYNIKNIEETSIVIGGNVIMYLMFILFSIIILQLADRQNRERIKKLKKLNYDKAITYTSIYNDIINPLKMVILGAAILIFASTSNLTRLAQFFQIFIIILLPNAIAKLRNPTRICVKGILYIFLIAYFWRYSLSVNSLDIIPYKLFF